MIYTGEPSEFFPIVAFLGNILYLWHIERDKAVRVKLGKHLSQAVEWAHSPDVTDNADILPPIGAPIVGLESCCT